MLVVVDIDGTLADLRPRLHFIKKQPKDYAGFFAALGGDVPHKHIVQLTQALNESGLGDTGDFTPDFQVVLASGRNEDLRHATEDWLWHNGVFYSRLYMRGAKDFRPDYVIKKELLAQIIADYGRKPDFVIDDRPSVVEMWLGEGIPVLQHLIPGGDIEEGHWPQATLFIMVGPSGAGKSTWLKDKEQYYTKFPACVVSSDGLRDELCGDWRDQSKNDEVFSAFHAIIHTRLTHGLVTYADATHIKTKDRLATIACAPKGAKIHYIVLDRPLEEKLKNSRTPGEIIKKHHNTFQSNLQAILAGDNLPNVTVHDLRSNK